ncbi:MAG: helix-turn-helix transcriptional regulator [Firmicutes bacterium]|nr:helix-turn-helix transcriptional regulator [Bacillota bacterium]
MIINTFSIIIRIIKTFFAVKCCKLFRSYINQTPNAYLISYRLNQSIKLLCNTDKSISDIAFDVGFHGASYYSETFRKWFGISPTKYK